jgi:hypothetical protein
VNAAKAKAEAKALRPWYAKKRVIFPIVLVALIGISSQLGGGQNSTPSSNGSAENGNTEESAAPTNEFVALGVAATDDDSFTFTVSSVKCGIKKVGDDFLETKAQGQYCAVSLTVENVGDSAEYFFSDSQLAFDTEGREFSVDSTATLYGNKNSDLWLKEINPGNKLSGKIFFDIADGATLEYLELHATSFSEGVKFATQ